MSDVNVAKRESAIRESIGAIENPYTHQPLGTKAVKSVEISGNAANVTVTLGFPCTSWHEALKKEACTRVTAEEGIDTAFVSVNQDIQVHSVQNNVKPINGVKNIICVASGKGGVGKSTLSSNLALALSAEGAKVGVLDADIYGPSQHRMLGISGRPQTRDGRTMIAMEAHGISVMSIGFMIDDDTPMIWRGPMVTQALDQLLNDTAWEDVDYLVIDMPPGTGDIQLSLSQKIPVSGAVIVSTPQDIALLDARKAYKMFEKVSIPVLGVVENMSTHICSVCGHEEHIFGEGGAARMAEEYGLKFLGDIPLSMAIRQGMDAGKPAVAVDADGEIGKSYRSIATKTAIYLSEQGKDYSAAFPQITIQQN